MIIALGVGNPSWVGPISSLRNPAEVYVPLTGQKCRLPDVPGGFYRIIDSWTSQTMEGMTICSFATPFVRDEFNFGPYSACYTLRDDEWEKATDFPDSSPDNWKRIR